MTNIHKSEVNKGNGFLFIFNSVTISVIWNKAYFFLFDSHSRDASGNISENGTSVLLQFRSLTAIEKYVRSVYMKNNDYMQYDMQYIQFSQAANLANSQDNSRQLPSDVHFICTSTVNQNIARKRNMNLLRILKSMNKNENRIGIIRLQIITNLKILKSMHKN